MGVFPSRAVVFWSGISRRPPRPLDRWGRHVWSGLFPDRLRGSYFVYDYSDLIGDLLPGPHDVQKFRDFPASAVTLIDPVSWPKARFLELRRHMAEGRLFALGIRDGTTDESNGSAREYFEDEFKSAITTSLVSCLTLLFLCDRTVGETESYPRNASSCEQCHAIPAKFGSSRLT